MTLTSPMPSHHLSIGALPRTVRKTTTPVDIPTPFVDLIGFVATSFSICMWVPQARITWRNRHDAVRLAGVSETTQWLSMIGYLLWGVFGLLIGSFWVAAPSIVSFPLSLATIIVVRRSRRPARTTTVPIISMTEPLSVTDTTGAVPILSTQPVPTVAGRDTITAPAAAPSAEAPTTPIPVLA